MGQKREKKKLAFIEIPPHTNEEGEPCPGESGLVYSETEESLANFITKKGAQFPIECIVCTNKLWAESTGKSGELVFWQE